MTKEYDIDRSQLEIKVYTFMAVTFSGFGIKEHKYDSKTCNITFEVCKIQSWNRPKSK